MVFLESDEHVPDPVRFEVEALIRHWRLQVMDRHWAPVDFEGIACHLERRDARHIFGVEHQSAVIAELRRRAWANAFLRAQAFVEGRLDSQSES